MTRYVAFQSHTCLGSGPLIEVAMAVKAHIKANPEDLPQILDAHSSRPVDLDLRGNRTRIEQWIAENIPAAVINPDISSPKPRGRGRPKLGVVSKEITLLPRQWDWLATQQGGASATLRRLVDEAARSPTVERREAQDAAYRFAMNICGDAPGYEEAMRALYAADRERFDREISTWGTDVVTHLDKLTQQIWQG